MKKQKQDTIYRNVGRKKTPIVEGKKICSKCQQSKQIEEYTKPSKPWCKSCVKKNNQANYKENKARLKVQMKKYEDNNRESINAYRRKRERRHSV